MPIGGLIRKHRLAREIIAMLVGGSMINRMGPFFVLRAEEETGANVAQVARAYAIVRDVFDVRRLWREIEALDYKVEAQVQYDSIFQISRMVRRAVYWFLQNYRARPRHRADGHTLSGRRAQGARRAAAARLRALRRSLRAGLEAIRRARPAGGRREADRGLERDDAGPRRDRARARVPPAAGRRSHSCISRSRTSSSSTRFATRSKSLAVDGRWRAMARATLRETLAQQQRALMRSALASHGGQSMHRPRSPRGSSGTRSRSRACSALSTTCRSRDRRISRRCPSR